MHYLSKRGSCGATRRCTCVCRDVPGHPYPVYASDGESESVIPLSCTLKETEMHYLTFTSNTSSLHIVYTMHKPGHLNCLAKKIGLKDHLRSLILTDKSSVLKYVQLCHCWGSLLQVMIILPYFQKVNSTDFHTSTCASTASPFFDPPSTLLLPLFPSFLVLQVQQLLHGLPANILHDPRYHHADV